MDILNAKKWYVVSVLLAVLFIFSTPLELYHSLGVYLALIEAFFCAAFLFMGLVGIRSFNDIPFVTEEEYPELTSTLNMVIPIVVLLAISFAIIVNSDKRIDTWLQEKGVITTAKIRDGFRVTTQSRRGSSTTSKIQITFRLANNKLFNASSDVSDDVYNNLSRGQGVDIIYLPQNPSIFKVIIGDENATKFAGITNRNLNFQDLEKVLSLPVDSVRNYLNTISVYWTTTRKNKNYYYANESKNEWIARSPEGDLIYGGPDLLNIHGFLKDLIIEKKMADSTATDKDPATLYFTDKYVLRYNVDVDASGPGLGVSGILLVRRRDF